DDVERALEHAEERQRRPEQEPAPDEAERGRVVLDRADRAQDRRDRGARERLLQLADEERVGVGLVDEPEQREREEEQRDERQEREVGDHRRQVRAAVGEELAEDAPHARQYARTHGRGPGDRRDDRDLAAGEIGRGGRRRQLGGRLERRPGGPRGRGRGG